MENKALTVKQTELLFGNKIRLHSTKLEFIENVNYDEWEHIGEVLKYIKGSVQWWIGDWIHYGEKAPWGEKYTQAIEETGKSYQTLADTVSVVDKFDFSRRHENLSFSHHREVAYLKPAIQDKLLNKAEKEEWNRKELRAEVKKIKQQNTIEIPLPKNKYNCIVIDPPWPYGTEYNKENRRIASPYKELPIEELYSMKLPSANDCVLWLWTTHKFIWDAKKLLEHWEFEYKLICVWDKEKLGMGVWLRCQAEFCLLGIKGQPKWNLTNERDIIKEPRKKHSIKPIKFYEMVKQLTPNMKRVNMFGREKITGFDGWGDEAK